MQLVPTAAPVLISSRLNQFPCLHLGHIMATDPGREVTVLGMTSTTVERTQRYTRFRGKNWMFGNKNWAASRSVAPAAKTSPPKASPTATEPLPTAYALETQS